MIAIKQDYKLAIAVGTGDGVLCLVKVQMEGKRIMTADEFVCGQRNFVVGRLG